MITVSFDFGSIGLVVGGLLAAVFGILLLRWIIRAVRRFLFAPKLHGLDRAGLQRRWNEIETLVGTGNEMQLKIAVMEADKLLDHALKALAMPGQTLGERLKYAAYKYPRIRNVWNAHRLRNQLAHESSFYLDPGAARRAVADFRDALRLLNLL